jgi:biotin operon repressor
MATSDNILDYLSKKIDGFKVVTKKGQFLFTCPQKHSHCIQSDEPTVTPINGTKKYQCLLCGWKGSFEDCVRLLEPDKKEYDDNKINEYLMDVFKTNPYPILDEYVKKGWDLVAIKSNSKEAFHKDWIDNENKDKSVWIRWINQGLNIGLNCKKSGLLVLDVDYKKDIPEDKKEIRNKLIELLKNSNTVVANTVNGGQHFLYKTDSDLNKQFVNLYGTKIDSRTNGYICIEPSKIENKQYIFANIQDRVKEIPQEIKEFILDLIKKDDEEKNKPKINLEETKEMGTEDFSKTLKLKNNNLDGCCNDTFTKLGGALIKRLNPNDAGFVLHLLNNNLLEHPMETKTVNALVGSLQNYKKSDSASQKESVYETLKLIDNDVTAKDIMEHLGYPRSIVNKCLSELFKEGKVIKLSRGRYKTRSVMEWISKEPLREEGINFKIPYFDEIMDFEWGDILLVGAKRGTGKSTLAVNMLQQLIAQGLTPYYISTEANSRFKKTGKHLGIVEEDLEKQERTFKFKFHKFVDPMAIELPQNAVTLIDWLQIKDFTQTANVFQALSDELERKSGILIIMMQIRGDNNWFAPDLVEQFPSLAVKFIWDDEDGRTSRFETTKIRDSKLGKQIVTLETSYNPETKILEKKTKII